MPAVLTSDAAATALRSGGIVAYPTEAVWGLGCDPFNAEAVQRLVAVRPDQALRQHQVRQVGFADFGKDLVGGHLKAPRGRVGLGFALGVNAL